ncbi:hypothetical protein PIB30_042965 [Stylosanthes scabra]|uniref:Uncharacterized protein n=1 Tax=Stylosanthes scabra TaxID=79078 RepID=A0ABU6QFY8_9FABA|nr:hypothetical protein [Stylosanthes scabra]
MASFMNSQAKHGSLNTHNENSTIKKSFNPKGSTQSTFEMDKDYKTGNYIGQKGTPSYSLLRCRPSDRKGVGITEVDVTGGFEILTSASPMWRGTPVLVLSRLLRPPVPLPQSPNLNLSPPESYVLKEKDYYV